jgi:hypothetical protein
MDPGVLCPNSALEAIAWRAPKTREDLDGLSELKGWFRREFGGEIIEVGREPEAAVRPAEPATPSSGASPSGGGGGGRARRGGRGRGRGRRRSRGGGGSGAGHAP